MEAAWVWRVGVMGWKHYIQFNIQYTRSASSQSYASTCSRSHSHIHMICSFDQQQPYTIPLAPNSNSNITQHTCSKQHVSIKRRVSHS
jgi:hypothetical protein